MINWNEVKVGETEIVADGYSLRKIIGVCGDWVWIKNKDYTPATLLKIDLDDWTICDQWEEISDQCEWRKYEGSRDAWYIVHIGKVLSCSVMHKDPNYKSDGRRVWKRRVG